MIAWFLELESGKVVCSVFYDIRKALDRYPTGNLFKNFVNWM